MSMVSISSATPRRAKNSHSSGMSTPWLAVRALTVSRPSEGWQSTRITISCPTPCGARARGSSRGSSSSTRCTSMRLDRSMFGGQHVEARGRGLHDHLVRIALGVEQQVGIVGTSCVAMPRPADRVPRVDDLGEHAAAVLGERRGEVDGRRGLAHAALLVAQPDDAGGPGPGQRGRGLVPVVGTTGRSHLDSPPRSFPSPATSPPPTLLLSAVLPRTPPCDSRTGAVRATRDGPEAPRPHPGVQPAARDQRRDRDGADLVFDGRPCAGERRGDVIRSRQRVDFVDRFRAVPRVPTTICSCARAPAASAPFIHSAQSYAAWIGAGEELFEDVPVPRHPSRVAALAVRGFVSLHRGEVRRDERRVRELRSEAQRDGIRQVGEVVRFRESGCLDVARQLRAEPAPGIQNLERDRQSLAVPAQVDVAQPGTKT